VSYLAASLSAGCVLSLLLAMLFGPEDLLRTANLLGLKRLTAMTALFSGFSATLGLLPALAAIVYSERRGVRSFWFHTYAGALVGTMSYLLFLGILTFPEPKDTFLVLSHSLGFPAVGVWLVTTTAGFLGGLVYWVLAGRSAGILRVRPASLPGA
jgi:hypothetical protein